MPHSHSARASARGRCGQAGTTDDGGFRPGQRARVGGLAGWAQQSGAGVGWPPVLLCWRSMAPRSALAPRRALRAQARPTLRACYRGRRNFRQMQIA